MDTSIASSSHFQGKPRETELVLPESHRAEKRIKFRDINSENCRKYIPALLNHPFYKEVIKTELQKLHLEGNEYFNKSQWWRAVERYSQCIQFALPFSLERIPAGAEIKRDILVVSASNRTQALLNQRLWETALLSAEEALKYNPKHVKSLYRKAKAFEGLQDYKKAFLILEEALELSPNNKVIKDTVDHCKALHRQSVTGEYNIAKLLCRPGPTPIFSDYVGPLEIRSTSHAGRGIFLTEDVEAGKILMVSNGLAFGASERDDRGEQYSGLTEEIIFLCNSSKRFLHQVHYLRTSNTDNPRVTGEIPSMDLFIPGNDWCPKTEIEIPSWDEVWGKAVTNSFDAHRTISPLTFGEGKSELAAVNFEEQMGVIGIWGLPSFFNHSCAPNCSTLNIGRAMFVRAAEAMPVGTELTISYVSTEEIDRDVRLKHWNFSCRCRRCLHDRKIRPLIQELLDDLNQLQGKLEETGMFGLEVFEECSRLVARVEDAIRKLPMELSDREKNWVRFAFNRVYFTKLRFASLMSTKERIELLKHLQGAYESVNVSGGGSYLQLGASILKVPHGFLLLTWKSSSGLQFQQGLLGGRGAACFSDLQRKFMHSKLCYHSMTAPREYATSVRDRGRCTGEGQKANSRNITMNTRLLEDILFD
ncbi:hypothetical protein R1flu_014700 [Riccia fluitans]|uniref:SET domain-containing protein n=1 Tax=Riccia fluitans TaxID=41844 RepID=A0ABD1YHZ1_9MARC